MDEPIATPKPPSIPTFESLHGTGPARVKANAAKEVTFSSSPGFGTPAYPVQPRAQVPVPAFNLQPQPQTVHPQSVLPVLIPPQTLRPVAFRTLTKRHNLTLTSSGLGALSTFIGKFCGSRWREEGLAERVLDEVAKQWKRENGGLILDDGTDKRLKNILKSLEPCMSGGKVDISVLSRSNSMVGTLSRQSSGVQGMPPGLSRENSQANSRLLGQLSIEDAYEHDDLNGNEDDEEISKQDARTYLRVISALEQPRLIYSVARRALEPVLTAPSLLPPVKQKIIMFRNRYQLVHQRLLRNESFQTSTSDVTALQQAYKITPVSNLLGRSGSSHLLLGQIIYSAVGDLCLTDLSGSVVLDISSARVVPEDGIWVCPGMIVLAEGTYEEDGTNNSGLGNTGGVGGSIKGRFVAETIAGPPAERREVTLGAGHAYQVNGPHHHAHVAGAGFGWVDFLGVGSEKVMGSRMRRISRRLLGRAGEHNLDSEPKRTKMVVIGECNFNSPRTIEAIRAILSTYTASGEVYDRPLTIVLMGNFVSAASMAGSAEGGGSIEYKEQIDSLASTLSEFPAILSTTTIVFVPGDNDPWASSFSGGAATALPRPGIPELFTSRIRRAINTANGELGRPTTAANPSPGEAVWTSNPARISLFGPVDEIVLFRDDITGRLRRNAVLFPNTATHATDADAGVDADHSEREDNSQPPSQAMLLDPEVEDAASHLPQPAEMGAPSSATASGVKPSIHTARKLVKTIIDQSHLSPFPVSVRPVLWDWAASLNLYPLPTALVLADSEAPAFAITYEGCHVMNPGRVLDDYGARKGLARWIEYDVKTKRGAVREVRF